MAASLSRPDPTSPASVAEAGFSTARRGYHTDEVRAFLMSVAAEMSRLKERERQLEAELRAARAASTGRVELDEEAATKLLGEETLRVLQTARESASQIKTRAEDNAARVMREAHDEAARVRQEVEVEAARKRQDAQSDAEAEVAIAKQQGRDMVNEARSYRERVLADLERRTQLARTHIEELAQGRERLLQVFERARLVAVDVTSGLQAIDGPEEFVNFAPTTGPVPLIVPATRRPPAPADDVAPEHVDAADDLAGAPHDEHVDVADDLADDLAGAPHDEHLDVAETDDVDVDVDVDVEPAPPVPSTNVVSLFRDRVAGELDGSDAVDPSGDAGRPDVDGLFARLRSEVPDVAPESDVASEDAVDTPPEAVPAVDAMPAATAFTRREEAIVPLIVTAARKLKRTLADEQNGVLDALRRKDPVTALDAIAPAPEAHLAVYAEAIGDELAAAASAGAGEIGAADTKTLRRTLAKAGALDPARSHISSSLIDPLRVRLERAVSDGHGDNDEITKRVRAVYREWKTQHIDDQLDDVFRFAFGGGLAVTVEPGTPMVWTIDPSEAACADCEDNSLAGLVPAGQSFPTGHVSAPAHPGCRCLTLPADD